jgi:DNA-binding protein HU-beta
MIDAVIKSSEVDISKSATNSIFDALFGVISKTVKKDGRVAIPGFGVFKVTKRKARKGRNPQTGEVIKIKASKSVSFKPAPSVKNSL